MKTKQNKCIGNEGERETERERERERERETDRQTLFNWGM